MMKAEMNAETYPVERLQNQINWLERKSSSYQMAYRRLRLAEIVLGAMIPLASSIAVSLPRYEVGASLFVGVLGVAIASIMGILSIGQDQENCLNYRNTCELLERQKFLFQTGIAPYHEADAFHKLVQTTDHILSKGNSRWNEYVLEQE